jgi:HK97 family phage major capsid protein
MLTPKAALEISLLADKAQALSATGNAQDRAVASVLLSKIKNIRSQECSSDELRATYAEQLISSLKPETATTTSSESYKRAFHRYLYSGEKHMSDSERRDLEVGTQTISWTQGAAGGYLVPLDYERTVFTALAQTDPVVSSSVTGFTTTDSPSLQPQILQGWDLSSIEATQIGETVQQTAGSFPTVNGRVLAANKVFKVSLAASFEAETDVPGTMAKMATAFGIGFARRLGADAINGNGITTLQGLLTAITVPSYTTGSGKITYNDLSSIYFGVNKVYRSSARCAWLMSDSVYERVRNAVDNQGRPLLDFVDDKETILGKPVYITPSLGAVGGSLALNSTIVFGDLSHYVIRTSKPTLQRSINTLAADVTRGEALYIARIRADAAVFDPSSGSTGYPPIITATVTA